MKVTCEGKPVPTEKPKSDLYSLAKDIRHIYLNIKIKSAIMALGGLIKMNITIFTENNGKGKSILDKMCR